MSLISEKEAEKYYQDRLDEAKAVRGQAQMYINMAKAMEAEVYLLKLQDTAKTISIINPEGCNTFFNILGNTVKTSSEKVQGSIQYHKNLTDVWPEYKAEAYKMARIYDKFKSLI